MLVRVEAVRVGAARQDSSARTAVRVHSAVGTAVALWQGALVASGREHHVEWTVDQDIVWATNAGPAAFTTPEVREDGDHIVFRGRLSLTGDGAAVLDVAGTLILFDLAEPLPPDDADGTWIEVRAGRDHVRAWPYQL